MMVAVGVDAVVEMRFGHGDETRGFVQAKAAECGGIGIQTGGNFTEPIELTRLMALLWHDILPKPTREGCKSDSQRRMNYVTAVAGIL